MGITPFLVSVALVALALSAVMAVAWLIWRATGNSGWVDTTWTFGLGGVGALAAIVMATVSDGPAWRAWVVLGLILVWATRLGVHIAQRSAGITDDPRYAKLVEGWGADAKRQMFWLLQKQALVSIPLAMTIVLAAASPISELRLQDGLGVLVFLLAVAGAGLADTQLKRFRADPANSGQVCDIGLWRYSRHPNYFFEWLGWLAIALLAIDVSGAYLWGWLALVGPAFMYWLLVHVTGIPPLEAHMLARRGAVFRAYQARTSAFFPAPPRAAEKAATHDAARGEA